MTVWPETARTGGLSMSLAGQNVDMTLLPTLWSFGGTGGNIAKRGYDSALKPSRVNTVSPLLRHHQAPAL